MKNKYSEIELLKKSLDREKKARKKAEEILEKKGLELYESSQELKRLNLQLEFDVKQKSDSIVTTELLFHDLINSAADIIFKTDLNGNITFINLIGEQVTGYSKKELLDNNYSFFVRKDFQKILKDHFIDQINNKKKSSYIEYPIVTKSGSEIWFGQSTNLVVEKNQAFSFFALARNISEVKRTQKLLKQSEEKYRGVLENLELGILEVNNDDKIIKAYQKFCDLSGYTEDELIGKNPADLFLDEETQVIMQQQNEKRKDGHSSVYEIPLKKKNGEIKWVIISGAPFFNENGEIIGTIGIHLDISDRKKMESELRLAKNKAEELHKVKELFLANMSHEIRTPMNAIIGMSELLLDTSLDPTQNKYLNAIEISSNNLLALINDILDFSKIEMNEMKLDIVNFNLPKLLSNIKDTLSHKAEQNGVNFSLNIEGKVPSKLKGDPGKLNQVLINLVSNAIKFSKNNEVLLKVELLELNGNKCEIKFSVKDNGIGIDQEDISIIFKNFKQAKNSISSKYGGTGLGLPISDKIVRLMEGEIKVESEIKKGSLFYFTISLEKSDKIHDIEVDKELKKDFKNASILIVDDNPVNMLMITSVLKKWNCQIAEANNGIVAINLLKSNNYDLILMDLQMPKMGGLEATIIIRKKMNIKTPIIALTANAIIGDNDKCLIAGMDDYLSKPFKQIELNNKMSKLLNLKVLEHI